MNTSYTDGDEQGSTSSKYDSDEGEEKNAVVEISKTMKKNKQSPIKRSTITEHNIKHTNRKRKMCNTVKKRTTVHFSADDVLNLCKAWIEQSHKSLQCGKAFWDGVKETCENKYGLTRSVESLRCKWKQVAHDAQLWLACVRDKKRHLQTGGISPAGMEAICQNIFSYRSSKNGKIGNQFKYISSAEYLSRFPKFMGLQVENNIVVGAANSNIFNLETVHTGDINGQNVVMNKTVRNTQDNIVDVDEIEKTDNQLIRSIAENNVDRREENSVIRKTNEASRKRRYSDMDSSGRFSDSTAYTQSNVKEVIHVGVEEQEEGEMIPTLKRRQGIKLLKKEEAERQRHQRNYDVIVRMEKEMNKTNDMINKLIVSQDKQGDKEMLCLALQCVPNDTEEHKEILATVVQAARDVHRKLSLRSEQPQTINDNRRLRNVLNSDGDIEQNEHTGVGTTTVPGINRRQQRAASNAVDDGQYELLRSNRKTGYQDEISME